METETGFIKDAPGELALWPVRASTMAGPVDLAFYGLMAASLAILFVIGGVILYFTIRYHAGSPASRAGDSPTPRALWFEVGWTIPTLIIFIGLFFWSGALYIEQYRLPEDALPINVIAKQWMWKIEHTSGVREINELHVPVGEKIMLRFTSQDVIHSFYIPAFRTKRDVLPGRYTSLWFEATEPGIYSLFCAEYCGVDHSRMRGRVVVMTPADFERWLGHQDVPAAPAERGERLFTAYGCAGCHTGDSAVHAPRLAGLYGKPVALADGRSVIADHGYIRDSILLPEKQVAAGYQPVMPSFEGQVSESDILALVAYIRTLGDATGAAR